MFHYNFMIFFFSSTFITGETIPEATVIRAGIILTVGTDLPYDYNVVAPSLQAAYERSLTEYNVAIEAINFLYEGGCSTSKAVGNTMLAVNKSVDFLIGPACTEDMMMSLELQTYFLVPSVTGGGDLVDSTAKFPYVTRCSYNTYTQWIFFVRMCIKYKWTNVAVIFDKNDHAKTVNSESLRKNLRDNDLRFSEFPFTNNSAGNVVGKMNRIRNILMEANLVARVFVLLMNGKFVRQFMIAAQKAGFTSGDHIFFTLDPFRNEVILEDEQQSNWMQNELNVLQAYQSLFILTLRNTENEPRYKEFKKVVKEVAEREFPEFNFTANYYIASFYDSVLLYALTINETLSEGHSIRKDNTLELSQKFWNRTYPGASGLVYINPLGDRNDDHTIYQMTSNGSFIVVAEFYGYKNIYNPNYEYDQLIPFRWNNPGNQPPLNEPRCGYLGNKPECSGTSGKLGAALGILGTFVIIGVAFSYVIQQRIQRKQNLEQLDLLAEWNKVINLQIMQTEGSSNRIIPEEGKTSVLTMDFIQASDKTLEATFRGVRVIVRICPTNIVVVNRNLFNEIKIARSLNHENILRIQGLINGPERIAVLYLHCAKGSLSDVLDSKSIQLDWFFRASLIRDVVCGLEIIHTSGLQKHGRLSSLCIFVDSRFAAKIGDYGLPSFFHHPASPSVVFLPTLNSEFCSLLLWTAPELLREPFGAGSQEGDMYSLAIVMQQVAMGEKAYGKYAYDLDPQIIVARVQKRLHRPFRPKIDGNQCPPEITILIRQCWAENALERPRIAHVKSVLKQMEKGSSEKGNVLEVLIQRMESYNYSLEDLVEEKTLQYLIEKEKSEQLLYAILPRSVVGQLQRGEHVQPESYESVTVHYSDIVNFTSLASQSTPAEVVAFLNSLYTIFDQCIAKFDTYKVETIGDCYVVASGVPIRNGDQHAAEVCRMSLTLMAETRDYKIAHRPNEQLHLRLGAHTGPCVSGVVGTIMPRYCLFGDTVVIAGKMESTSKPMRIQLSESCRNTLDKVGNFETQQRENQVEISESLKMTTFWLIGECVTSAFKLK